MNNINKLQNINGDIKWNANSFEKLLKVKMTRYFTSKNNFIIKFYF